MTQCGHQVTAYWDNHPLCCECRVLSDTLCAFKQRCEFCIEWTSAQFASQRKNVFRIRQRLGLVGSGSPHTPVLEHNISQDNSEHGSDGSVSLPPQVQRVANVSGPGASCQPAVQVGQSEVRSFTSSSTHSSGEFTSSVQNVQNQVEILRLELTPRSFETFVTSNPTMLQNQRQYLQGSQMISGAASDAVSIQDSTSTGSQDENHKLLLQQQLQQEGQYELSMDISEAHTPVSRGRPSSGGRSTSGQLVRRRTSSGTSQGRHTSGGRPLSADASHVSHADASHTDVSHTDASHTDASHTDVSHPDASHTDVSQPDVSHTDASHTDVSHTDASHTDVSHTDASHTDASHTDASHTHVSQPVASHTNVSHTDASHTDVAQVVAAYTNVNLSQPVVSHTDVSYTRTQPSVSRSSSGLQQQPVDYSVVKGTSSVLSSVASAAQSARSSLGISTVADAKVSKVYTPTTSDVTPTRVITPRRALDLYYKSVSKSVPASGARDAAVSTHQSGSSPSGAALQHHGRAHHASIHTLSRDGAASAMPPPNTIRVMTHDGREVWVTRTPSHVSARKSPLSQGSSSLSKSRSDASQVPSMPVMRSQSLPDFSQGTPLPASSVPHSGYRLPPIQKELDRHSCDDRELDSNETHGLTSVASRKHAVSGRSTAPSAAAGSASSLHQDSSPQRKRPRIDPEDLDTEEFIQYMTSSTAEPGPDRAYLNLIARKVLDLQKEVRSESSVSHDLSRLASWNEIVALVKAAIPEAGSAEEVTEPVSTGRKGAFDTTPRDPQHLPWHSDIQQQCRAKEAEVLDQRASKGSSSGPLKAGSYLKVSKPAPIKYFAPLGSEQSLSAAEINYKLENFSQGPLKPVANVTVPVKALVEREKDQREILALHSHQSWLLDLIHDLLGKLNSDPESVKPADVDMVVSHSVAVNSTMTDRLVTQFANTVLQRRDIAMRSVQGTISYEILEKLRSSPFLSKDLFYFSDSIDEEMKKRKDDQKLHQILRGLKATAPPPKQQQQQKKGGPAKVTPPFRAEGPAVKGQQQQQVQAQARSNNYRQGQQRGRTSPSKESGYSKPKQDFKKKQPKSSGARGGHNPNYRGRGGYGGKR